MHFIKRPLTRHRRARLIAWTLAMLLWMAQVLCLGAPFTARHVRQRGPRMSIHALSRKVKMLIISRARDLAPRRYRMLLAYRGRTVSAPGALRAVIGARVGRMLNRKSLGARIAALVHALVHIDAYAALIAKRLKRGLTRRWRAHSALTPARNVPVASLARAQACFTDTS